MKNVTITIDDETHRAARIRAAEWGTSLSALVKDYLNGLANGPLMMGVREMPMSFAAEPMTKPFTGGGLSYPANNKPIYTKDGKPRQPGALRGKAWIADDLDEWSDDILASFEAWPYDDMPNPK